MKECCATPGNLELKPDHPDARPPDLSVKVCRVCGLRHFELTVDPGNLGLRGAEVGG